MSAMCLFAFFYFCFWQNNVNVQRDQTIFNGRFSYLSKGNNNLLFVCFFFATKTEKPFKPEHEPITSEEVAFIENVIMKVSLSLSAALLCTCFGLFWFVMHLEAHLKRLLDLNACTSCTSASARMQRHIRRDNRFILYRFIDQRLRFV